MIDLSLPSDSFVKYHFSQNSHPKGKKSISYIFMDNLNYLPSLYNIGKLRTITYDNIQKTILCGSIYLGYNLYVCLDCTNQSFIPHRCHSKFCTTCGYNETKIRATKIYSMALDAHQRHIVFTIPENLRRYFFVDRKLLHLLFIAARNALACLFNNQKFKKLRRKHKINTSNISKTNMPIRMIAKRLSLVLF